MRATRGERLASIGLVRWAVSRSESTSPRGALLQIVTSKTTRSQLPANVVFAGHDHAGVFERDSEARRPRSISHQEAGAEARAEQLARVGAGGGPALGRWKVDPEAPVVVLDLAGKIVSKSDVCLCRPARVGAPPQGFDLFFEEFFEVSFGR
jgi:hypothetical protein